MYQHNRQCATLTVLLVEEAMQTPGVRQQEQLFSCRQIKYSRYLALLSLVSAAPVNNPSKQRGHTFCLSTVVYLNKGTQASVSMCR